MKVGKGLAWVAITLAVVLGMVALAWSNWGGMHQELRPEVLRHTLRRGMSYEKVLAAVNVSRLDAPLAEYSSEDFPYVCRLSQCGFGCNFVWQHQIMLFFDKKKCLLSGDAKWTRVADERLETLVGG